MPVDTTGAGAGLTTGSALAASRLSVRVVPREPPHAAAERIAIAVSIAVIATARGWECAYMLNLLRCRARVTGAVRYYGDRHSGKASAWPRGAAPRTPRPTA